MSVGETQVSRLIETRIQELGITSAELARRCGFQNVAKGLRRLNEVCAGDFSRAGFLLSSLPDALSLEPYVVEAAIVATRQAKEREQEQRYRNAFQPHGIVVCERTIPEPLFVAAIIGVDRILRVDFANGSAPITYAKQALCGVKQKLVRWGALSLPAFGRPQSIIVNYTYDNAVEFDLEGNPKAILNKAVGTGTPTLGLAGRSITLGELGLMLGDDHKPS